MAWHQLTNPANPHYHVRTQPDTAPLPATGVWLRSERPDPDDPYYSVEHLVVNGHRIARIPCHSGQDRTAVFQLACRALRDPLGAVRSHYTTLHDRQPRFDRR